MKYQFNTKMVASLIATTLIVSGLAYAATTITNTSQTVVNNDIMSAAWFNDVNSKLANLGTKMTTVESKLSNVSTAQNRISGSCPSGKAIQSIAADGTVTCVSTGGNLSSGTFYGTWGMTYWETHDQTYTISCHKPVANILVGPTSNTCGYDNLNGGGASGYIPTLIPLAHACAETPNTSITLAPSCIYGQLMGQPPARVVLRVTNREAGDWPDIGTTYVFGNGPGELPFNQEHLVWDYWSNGRNRLWLTVSTTDTVTNLRVRAEDYSSNSGGVGFSTEVQFVGN